MNKEEIYDSRISPLMTQIIQICKEHKIAMIMSFAIPTKDDPDLMCSTALLEDEYEPTLEQIAALHSIDSARAVTPLMITTQNQDGSVVKTAVLG